MNAMTIEPVDPPMTKQEFQVCYEWNPGVPGQVVDVTLEYGPDSAGSIGAQFACPGDAPFKSCKWFTPPQNAEKVKVFDETGNAIPLARNFV